MHTKAVLMINAHEEESANVLTHMKKVLIPLTHMKKVLMINAHEENSDH